MACAQILNFNKARKKANSFHKKVCFPMHRSLCGVFQSFLQAFAILPFSSKSFRGDPPWTKSCSLWLNFLILVANPLCRPPHAQNYDPSWKLQQGVAIFHFSSTSFRGDPLHGQNCFPSWRLQWGAEFSHFRNKSFRGDPSHGQNYAPSGRLQWGVAISHLSSKSFRGVLWPGRCSPGVIWQRAPDGGAVARCSGRVL